MSDRPILDPILKWCGGKRWLAPRILDFWTSQGQPRLVDPFAGGLAVPLELRSDKAIISDVNPHLMNFYRWVQHGLQWSADTGIIFELNEKIYYENRSKFNALCAAREYWTREGALLFYYLNRTCFNGLCRFNRDGFFNVPFGRYKTVNYMTDFSTYKLALLGWELFHGDFASLPIQSGDFVYADPPYDVEFTQFAMRDFTWEDQERLARWLAKHDGPVMASNQATPRIISLYQSLDFEVYSVEAPRTISSNGDRTPATEIIAIRRTAT